MQTLFPSMDHRTSKLIQEIFNCCSEEEVSHCLRADFAHYFPEAKVLVLGLENSWENAGA